MKKRPEIIDVLFISMGGIGNLVLLTPAIRAFGSIYPNAHLHFILPGNGSRQVVECHHNIGKIIEITPSLQSFPSLIMQVRKIHPDLIIAASGTNSLKSGLIGLLGGVPLRLGESFGAGRFLYNITIPFDQDLHECTSNLRLIAALSSPMDTLDPTVWTSDQDRHVAQWFIKENNLDCRWIGLHLGSGSNMSYKRWPLDRFVNVARRLVNKYSCRIIIFGGQKELSIANEAAAQIGSSSFVAVGKCTIRESFEVMKHASLFISNDSGPMHLAAAAGAPVIAIFGPTMEKKTSPLGKRSTVITSVVSCRPCYEYKPIKCKTLKCLKGISVESVVEAAETVLDAE